MVKCLADGPDSMPGTWVRGRRREPDSTELSFATDALAPLIKENEEKVKTSVAVHALNPSLGEAEAGGLQ